MKKERMITKRITVTNADILWFNPYTNEIQTHHESYIGDLSDKEIEKKFSIDYDNTAKFLKIVSAEKSTKLFAISESDFLRYAVEID